MKLMLEHQTFKGLCVGMSGCGKTQLANRIIRQSNYRWYFIFDPDGQFSQRNDLKAAFDTKGIHQQLSATGFVVYNPSEMFDDMTEAFDWWNRYAYKMSERLPGLKIEMADELQDITGTGTIPPWFKKTLMSGRNRGLDFLACTLQYNQIHNAVRGQITDTFAFRTNEALALKALTERGFNAGEIAALKDGEYIHRNRAGRESRGRIF